MGEIEFLIAVLFAAALLVRLADLVAIPYPIVLVIGGVAIGFVPGLPDIELAPEAIFLVFLPPLLHAAGFAASPQELRAASVQLISLTFALVLVTVSGMFLALLLSFAVIGRYWLLHHDDLQMMTSAGRRMLVANLVFLFFIIVGFIRSLRCLIFFYVFLILYCGFVEVL